MPVQEESRRKEYKLTDKGMVVLKKELSRLLQLTRNGLDILGEVEA